MGKRSDFERKPRDYYVTPLKAVEPLVPHLVDVGYMEPCAGDGSLIKHLALLKPKMKCYSKFDIEPQASGIETKDALKEEYFKDVIITNPPWDRKFLHPFLDKIIDSESVAWLLFDADWAHTKQAIPYLKHCARIISVGRVKWFDNTTGKDNCAWYKFVPYEATTTFVGQQE